MKTTRKRLPAMSVKRALEWKVYVPLARAFHAVRPFCERCASKGKKAPASKWPHHWAGRRSNFLKVETWRASCDECNLWAKNHPKEAREEGWIAPINVYLT